VTAPASFWTNEEPRLHLAGWDSEGPPVLLVHGMGAHTRWWDEVGEALAAACRPVALDLSGHGDSGWRADGVYTGRGWARDIEDARHALGWERFALVAHSLGARVALEYAAEHPERLSSLAVIDFLPEFKGGRFSTPRSVPQPYYDSEQAILARFRLRPDATALPPERVRELGRASIKKAPRGWTWKYDFRAFHYAYEPIWPLLPRVKTRSLVVRGGLSKLMSEDALRRVAQGLGGAATADIAGAHHHVSLDRPAQLADAILRFLA
jgi:pimeloyl-ACP methyl ester carboxylesterase